MARGKKTEVGDFCDKGHKIEGDNVYEQKRSKTNIITLRCRICHKSQERERNQAYYKTERGMQSNRNAYLKRMEKTRAERYDKILAGEIVNQTGGRYVGLSYLNLNKRSQRAWEPLEKKFDQAKGNCYQNPTQYIDYRDDNIPLASEAYKMCKGCPMLVECARFAAAYKPVIGVWGGEVWIDGKVMR